MNTRVIGGIQLAAVVLLAGGALSAFAPVSLQHFGCTSGFGALEVESGTDMDVVFACAEERSQRQLGAAGLLSAGGALLAGATYLRLGSAPRQETLGRDARAGSDADA